MIFTLEEAKDLVELFDGDTECEIAVSYATRTDKGHSGPGLYAYYVEYPDEGSFLLGSGKPTQPCRLDAEKAKGVE